MLADIYARPVSFRKNKSRKARKTGYLAEWPSELD
jgi:hypothetical protein